MIRLTYLLPGDVTVIAAYPTATQLAFEPGVVLALDAASVPVAIVSTASLVLIERVETTTLVVPDQEVKH